MQLLCPIERDLQNYCHVGTSPSGENQPGCARLTYSWLKYVDKRSRSNTPESTAGNEATPTPENPYRTEVHDSYSDASFWDAIAQIYTISMEIKSDGDQGGEDQQLQQMIGLFRSWQQYMLGFVVKPKCVFIKILEKKQSSLIMHNFPCLTFSDETLLLMSKLIIAFIFFVNCKC